MAKFRIVKKLYFKCIHNGICLNKMYTLHFVHTCGISNRALTVAISLALNLMFPSEKQSLEIPAYRKTN